MKIVLGSDGEIERFEVEGETQREVFKQLAAVRETFMEMQCGKCESEDIHYVVRTNKKGQEFPELHCQNPKCRYRLAFGQNKEGGGVYPRRRYHEKHPLVKSGKAEEGAWMPDNGWEKPIRKNDEDGD